MNIIYIIILTIIILFIVICTFSCICLFYNKDNTQELYTAFPIIRNKPQQQPQPQPHKKQQQQPHKKQQKKPHKKPQPKKINCMRQCDNFKCFRECTLKQSI